VRRLAFACTVFSRSVLRCSIGSSPSRAIFLYHAARSRASYNVHVATEPKPISRARLFSMYRSTQDFAPVALKVQPVTVTVAPTFFYRRHLQGRQLLSAATHEPTHKQKLDQRVRR
jgi:hypothetical protein